MTEASTPVGVLLLEESDSDALLVEGALARYGFAASITRAKSCAEFDRALASSDVARIEADKLRGEARSLHVAYDTTRFEAQSPEWQRATEEAVRNLKGSLSGTYEFRVLREGAKVKVLKFKCGDCPATTPRQPRAPRQAPPSAPLPVTFTSAEWAGE